MNMYEYANVETFALTAGKLAQDFSLSLRLHPNFLTDLLNRIY